MSKLIINKLKYILFSKHRKGFGIHSPFLYDLITLVFNDKTEKVAYRKIDLLRNELEKSKEIINVTDYGAGSKLFKSSERKISEITEYSSVKKKYGELLYRISEFYKPKTILELGTSLGISCSYLASGNPDAKVVTIEGCPQISAIAQNTFYLLGIKNVTLVNGRFEEILPLSFFDLHSLDLVFFDGNHTKQATLNYFEQCVKYSNNDSIFIFDDIHWTSDMEQAWDEIKKNKNITSTVDIYQFGIVFFKKQLKKQDFIIRY
ncbi:MAG: methyltransferase [Bacteroidetes bacterium CG02_land_8_20_14_3_00_31_25]|nr:class I SAM-dependent methyltransferase [Bacteroidota bacterium]PIV58923.1 MAG: methyltransferase [Bacteroidetes bacterium CG02_land_8_20_14_3_00_31_25]PIX36155.1 MAG: methyltransferase [Bacteroidetes bacterium CG_4_8_14_3_um_filter_31_14]